MSIKWRVSSAYDYIEAFFMRKQRREELHFPTTKPQCLREAFDCLRRVRW